MRRHLTIFTAFCCLIANVSSAAVPAPVARHVLHGDPLRKTLLDALRPEIERDLGQKVIFVVRVLRVQGDWAFADLVPQAPGGRAIDFRRTRHAERVRIGMFDSDHDIYGLLRRKAGRWRVVTFAVAPTDVAWDGWTEEFGAPRSLFALPPE